MDIKPQNILLDKNLDAKITDFSISLSYENIKSNPKKIIIYANQEIKSYQIDNLSEKIIKSWKQIFQKNINEDIKIYIIYYETQTYSLNNGDLFGNYEIIEKDENSIRIKIIYWIRRNRHFTFYIRN